MTMRRGLFTLLLTGLPGTLLAGVDRGITGVQQVLLIGGAIFAIATVAAIWHVHQRQISEKPVRVLVFAAWFWVWVFALTLAFALVNAWLSG